MLKLSAAGMAAVVSVTLFATPASAKKPDPSKFSYVATVDCGKGPFQIGSGDDVWSPFVDLHNGQSYEPVAWHVKAGESLFDLTNPDAPKGKRSVCSYDDGTATGTVTLVRLNGSNR
jgi:hypothetical protein